MSYCQRQIAIIYHWVIDQKTPVTDDQIRDRVIYEWPDIVAYDMRYIVKRVLDHLT